MDSKEIRDLMWKQAMELVDKDRAAGVIVTITNDRSGEPFWKEWISESNGHVVHHVHVVSNTEIEDSDGYYRVPYTLRN